MQTFIEKARVVHGNRYDYRAVKYVASRIKVKIKCLKHGIFEQTPNSHLMGRGCPTCADVARIAAKKDTTETFIAKAKRVHGKTYSYANVQYVSSSTDISITCKIHGDFKQRPNNHLSGQGCSACCYVARGDRRRKTLQHFIDKAVEVHGGRYSYHKVKRTATGKVTIVCSIHGDFQQSFANHLKGQNCPLCAEKLRHSKISLEWLEYERRVRRLKSIQHAENGGEFKIPGTKYRADGFHKRSNTIFEFYGDMYHGNLEVYSPRSRPNPFSNLTALQLYRRTMRRERELRDLGYNLVTIWEHTFRAMCRGV